MAAEIVQIDTQDFTSQAYEGQDIGLISSFEVNTSLSSSSYIEYFVYDNNQNLLEVNYNFTQYTVLADGQSAGLNNTISQIIIDPEKSLLDSGYDQGEYITYFNFFNKQIGSELQQLYIVEISSDRTEIRLDSTSLTDLDIVEQANSLIQQREDSPYFLDFYLNFGDNQLAIANNIQLDNQDPTNPTILIKLYEALPEDFDINSTLWIVTLVEEPTAYKVTFEDIPIVITDTVPLSGPNFNLDLKDKINNSTVSLDYTTLTSTVLTSSQNQLRSLFEEKGLDINVDYTNFNDFIHFSSAQTRLENFYYKMSLLEDYSSSIALLNNTTNNNPSASLAIYEAQISNIITNFDDYEYYLYYTSGSYAWPKTTSQPPYQLATTGSVAVDTWYDNIILSASNFDNLNQNNLYYSIPEYLRDDPNNQQYQLFVEMVGQFYDNIWVYYKDVTQKYNADNRLEYGISKDIVADAIRDFGIKLYQNNFSNDNLYTAFLGLTPQGGLFPFPNITGSLPTPSGFEYIDTLISASNDYIPLDDVNKSLYKRIYHNLPYLLKAKGTLPALRTLITSYGIPDTVLRINEFGGKDKSNTNDWDDWQNVFNYAYDTQGTNYVSSSWIANPTWNSSNNIPGTVQFRFKTQGIPTDAGYYSQSLWTTDQGVVLRLRYTGSGYTSGSYSGSIPDPYNEYAHLDFIPDISSPAASASVYLPFFNGDWWSVMATGYEGTYIFKLYAGNNVYDGGDNGTQLGFYASSSISTNEVPWDTSTISYFPSTTNSSFGKMFSGSYQEIRYFSTLLNESAFKDYIMNPSSIEGNSLNSSPDQLIFRASLGGELYTGSKSIHPKVTGSWIPTSSFSTGNNFFISNTASFISNTEYFFLDQPVVGIKNAISDKIRLENSVIPTGSVLSPFRSLAQNIAASQSYTANTNLLEVAFAPQDEINDDIISQIGYFNIGEFIGDPRQRSSSATSYPDLDALRNEYFEKYTSNYDLNDYIRLIKYFDNSLFKMIKDFVPARTSLASGVIIKQTLLERNKYPQPQANINSTIAYASSGSVNNIPLVFQNIEVSGTVAPQWNDYQPGTIENFSGGTGGVFEPFNGVNTSPYGPNGTGPQNIFGITQSWYETATTPSGSVLVLHDAQDEFYDGEFSGSIITVTTQSLAQPYNIENISVNYKHVYYYGISKTQNDIFEDNFLAPQTSPSPGEILFFNYKEKGFLSNPALNTYTTTFIKIAKEDCNGNDNSLPLGQITKLYIFNPNQAIVYPSNYSLQFDEYDVIVSNEYSDYYLYETLRDWNILSAIGPLVGDHDNQVFDYTVSSSVTASYSVGNGSPKTIINWNSTLTGTNLSHYGTPYFNTSSGIFTFENTPNVPLIFSASINTSGNDASSRFMRLIQNRNGVETILFQDTYNAGGIDSTLITASLYPIQGDQYYIQLTKASTGVNVNVTNANLYLYQSWNNFTLDTWYGPSTSSCASTILEPYITTPNYYNSDYNPLINNVFVDRLSTIYQDVDYSTGIYTPTNFAQLISGSALKAAVQDSNYTSKRVIIPRYEGSKSTSQHLNYWTPGDTGTYGKLPTVESLKTMVAYCDDIGGWPPERMNASAAFVKYLIKADGTVVIPNTTPNSLADNQETFESGENILVQYSGTGNQATPIRKVIRGGTRIEPILYTQIGHTPPSWTSSISLYDAGSPANIQDNTLNAVLNPLTPSSPYAQNITSTDVPIGFTPASWNVTYDPGNNFSLPGYVYNVDNDTIIDGVNLIIDAQFIIENTFDNTISVTISPYKNTSPGDLLSPPETYLIAPNSTQIVKFDYNLTPEVDFISTDEFYFQIRYNNPPSGIGAIAIRANGSYFKITQNPLPNPLPTITVTTGSIWNYPTSSTYNQASSSQAGIIHIVSGSSPLNTYYNTPNVKQQDITGSGFNPITLDWSVKYGDEFRFEGREDRVFIVKEVYGPEDQSPKRVSNTGSVEVHFNSGLPSASINLDHFAIRRYVDDASQILIEGFKPNNSSGPYILRPEYIAPELDKNIDDFILILKEKGLI